jgi:hypothetical protein
MADETKTLTDKHIDKVMDKIIKAEDRIPIHQIKLSSGITK